MRLKFDGDSTEIHGATGVALVPGEAEYPDELAAALEPLITSGRLQKVEAPPEAPPAPAAPAKKKAAATDAVEKGKE